MTMRKLKFYIRKLFRRWDWILLKLICYYRRMKTENNRKVLIVVAHPDDAEISMGMMIKKHVEDGDEVKIIVLSKGGNKGKELEQIRVEECISAGKVLGLTSTSYRFGDIKDTVFSEQRSIIRKFLEDEIQKYNPDTMYTHFPSDYHLDHCITSEEAVIAGRSIPNIYYFRSPYSKQFFPNKFLFETENFYQDKNNALKCFKSQGLIETDMLKKLSNIEYVGLLHPNLVKSLFMSYGTKELYYEPFQVLREVF